MESATIGNIVSISKGRKHSSLFESPNGKTKRYIQIEDLRNDFNLKYTDEVGVDVNPKDVIIAWDGANAGTIGFDLNGYIGSTLARLRIKNGNVDSKYLGWLLRGKFNYLRSQCTGATIPHISKSVLENISVPILPIKTQQKIASILEQADAARQKRKQANQLTEQFLQSAFLEMFGDPVRNEKGWKADEFETLIEEMRYGTSVHCTDAISKNALPVLRIPNIIGGQIDLVDLKYAAIDEREKDKIILRDGDILFVRTNGNPAYIGRCAVFEGDSKILFASYLIRARLKKPSIVLPKFLNALFLFPSYRSEMLKRAKTTAGNYNINTVALKNLKIILPPLPLQQKFASLVEQVEQLRVKQRESEKELENLFGSLMQRYFG